MFGTDTSSGRVFQKSFILNIILLLIVTYYEIQTYDYSIIEIIISVLLNCFTYGIAGFAGALASSFIYSRFLEVLGAKEYHDQTIATFIGECLFSCVAPFLGLLILLYYTIWLGGN